MPYRGQLLVLSVETVFVYAIYVFALHALPLSNDMLSFYVLLELQALASYVLVASTKNNGLGLEASAKYFVLSSLASCMLLIGVALLYGLLWYN